MLVDGALRALFRVIDGVWAQVVVVLALAALLVVLPRSVRRVVRGSASLGDRAAAALLLAGLVAAGVLLFTPIDEGPYRCSAIAYGAEGRQTVRPDDRARLPSPSPSTEELRAELQRRQNVCDDAARARVMTAGAVVGAAALLAAGSTVVLRPSATEREEATLSGDRL